MRVADLDYHLPAGAIAQEAIEPRDAARLLIARTGEDVAFVELPHLLRAGDLLVVNRTRVRAARLAGRKPATGGAVELLLVERVDPVRWRALVKPSRRIRPGTVLDFGEITGEVLSPPRDGVVTVALASDGDVEDVLSNIGEVPLPPYFHGRLDDPERYQTIFAKSVGSAAAPTAALHFTPRVLMGLAGAGVSVAEVQLDVGLDTFRPMSSETVADHEIHTERFSIPPETVDSIERARRLGGRVVAVGTTVVRTLETASGPDGTVTSGEGRSSLFIAPGHRFQVVDVLITNFHAPRTTLIALVAAALPAWRSAYATALDRRLRFLSFGDAMLIDPVEGR
jgi:S-adenosylmethionine:tRNA ribosyltransferase-isomerase